MTYLIFVFIIKIIIIFITSIPICIFFQYDTGNGWVGWHKEAFPKGFVELVFEFSEIRNFSAVHIFTNNFFSKNVQVSDLFEE